MRIFIHCKVIIHYPRKNLNLTYVDEVMVKYYNVIQYVMTLYFDNMSDIKISKSPAQHS